MTEQFIKNASITRSPNLSIRDYQSAIDKYKDMQNAELETYIIFGTDAGGLTTYGYYKSTQNIIYIIEKYIIIFRAYSIVEPDWIESMESYVNQKSK